MFTVLIIYLKYVADSFLAKNSILVKKHIEHGEKIITK